MHHHLQDVVLAASFLGFNIALAPSIVSRHKPALRTSILTVFFQLAGFIVYIDLSLWYTATMSFVNLSLWAVLAVQKAKESR